MRNLSKKLLISVMSLLIICISFPSIALGSANNKVNITIKQSRYKGATSTTISTYKVSNYTDFYNAMESSINKIETSTKLVFENGYLKNNLQGFRTNMEKIISFVGTGSYINSYSIYQSVIDGKEVYEVEYNYNGGIEEARRKNAQVTGVINTVIPKIISSSMTIYEKEKAIHDYIVNTTRYDIEGADADNIEPDAHTPYGALVNNVAVCDGYATSMKKMLDKVGIENLIVVGEGDGVPHAWNLVKINSQWHHVDATWDDPISIVKGEVKHVLTYDYFNKTDSFMGQTHTWIRANYPKADSSVYKSKKGTRFMLDRYLHH